MAATTIGGEAWRNTSINSMKLSNQIVEKSDRSNDIGKCLDPLPHIRAILAELSNDEIKRYTRDVRTVVGKLRDSLLETNDEIKALTRVKESVEKALEHTRKDIRMNNESQQLRKTRPPRERDPDGADDLLLAEKSHFLNSKKVLEAHLKSVQDQLTTLDRARRRLFASLQERSGVLDLICHHVKPTFRVAVRAKTSGDGRFSRSVTNPDPLGAYTPDADLSLVEAHDARTRSQYLRREMRGCIEKIQNLQKNALKSVKDGLTGKINETITLQQHLGLSRGENRHATNRAQRWFDATEHAYEVCLGPTMYSDLYSREKLNRPQVSIFQRHPGTQLPEAQQIIKMGDGLLQSMVATSRNIGMMRLAHLSLSEDMRSKSAAASIDGSIVRLRNRRANHRWCLGAAF